jgi:hypothetical protein
MSSVHSASALIQSSAANVRKKRRSTCACCSRCGVDWAMSAAAMWASR